MPREKIEVVRVADLEEGDSTRGMVRAKAFEAKDLLVARSQIFRGAKSGWHHHGKSEVYGFLVSGKLRIEYGEDEKDSVAVEEGYFFHIPVGLVHRDVNPDQDQVAVVVNVFLGEGPSVVNVRRPSA